MNNNESIEISEIDKEIIALVEEHPKMTEVDKSVLKLIKTLNGLQDWKPSIEFMGEVAKIANESLLNDTICVLEGGVYIQIIEGAVGELQIDLEKSNMDEKADKLLVTPMVLEYLNISRTTLWRLMNQSENALPHLRVGRRLLFRSGDIQNWLDSSKKA